MKSLLKLLVNIAVFVLGIMMISFIGGIVVLAVHLVQGDGDVVGNLAGLAVAVVALLVVILISGPVFRLRDKLKGRDS